MANCVTILAVILALCVGAVIGLMVAALCAGAARDDLERENIALRTERGQCGDPYCGCHISHCPQCGALYLQNHMGRCIRCEGNHHA